MKRLFALLLSVTLCFGISACGSGGDEKAKENESATEEVIEEKAPLLELGTTVTLEDICEISLDYVNITKDVMPPQPGSWYSHYEAENGKVYVDVCLSYKNLATTDVNADEIVTGKLIYGEKYEYSGFSMIEEESRSDFTYSNITSIAPLSTEYIHYLFEVPEEVENSEHSVEAELVIGSESYRVAVKNGSAANDTPKNTASGTSKKDNATVAIGEKITINNAEFAIDYAEITKDVVPPQPADWYSHYEAEAGKVYVDFCVAYKNLGNNDIGADNVMSAKMTYAGKYEYSGFSMIEEGNRSDFTYSNITSISPLATEYVHYLFEVPEEVSTSNEPVEISFSIDGNTYKYVVR